MGASTEDVRACAAIDALRAGVVNRYIAQHLTFGRDEELAQIESTIHGKPKGSTQVLAGGHGVGKSHLCEVITTRLECAGYAVAKLELNASHAKAENPRAVLESIAQSLTVQIGDRRIRGNTELGFLIRASKKPSSDWMWDGSDLVAQVHKKLKGAERLLDRLDAIREEYHDARAGTRPWLSEPSLFSSIPSAMTAANLAVAAVNRAAHQLKAAGCKGIVLLFDEAERTTQAWSAYRLERARNLMFGYALASANKDTSHLKHYQNNDWKEYRPQGPARMHTLYCFTSPWGFAYEIASSAGTKVLPLQPLSASTLQRLERAIEALYAKAYGVRVLLSSQAHQHIRAASRTEDARALVRRMVAALDDARLAMAA